MSKFAHKIGSVSIIRYPLMQQRFDPPLWFLNRADVGVANAQSARLALSRFAPPPKIEQCLAISCRLLIVLFKSQLTGLR